MRIAAAAFARLLLVPMAAVCRALRGAVRALLLINEHLETELAKAYAAAADLSLIERGGSVLH